MALFTDAGTVTLDDLLQYETSLVQVASTHAINVDTKINLALSAIADRVLLWLLQQGATDPQWVTRRVIGLSTVVITPPLRKWICFEALSRFFSEAYNVQLNTRFQGKWMEYEQEAQSAQDMAFASGLGIVYTALAKPMLPLVATQAGNFPAGSIFVQTTWVDIRGDESAPSPVNGVVMPGQSTVTVSMAESANQVPPTAVGWNVYASTADTGLTLQNSSPLSAGSTWTPGSGGLIQGTAPGNGQNPDYIIDLTRRVLRG